MIEIAPAKDMRKVSDILGGNGKFMDGQYFHAFQDSQTSEILW